MSWRPRAIVLVLLVVLSSVAFAAGTAALPSNTSEANADGQVDGPPDPDSDVLGWECGYWHNESIDVDQSDDLDDEELAAIRCRTMARVEQIRGLEFEESVQVDVRSREEFRQEFQNRSTDPALRTFDNAKFEALFLINETSDSIEVQDRNSQTSILGYYSPGTGEIVLVAPDQSALQVDEYTLAHELVHALQDQHFNLSQSGSGTRDDANARSGLVEGEARYLEYLYRENRCHDPGHSWNGTCLTPSGDGNGSGGTLANIGVYFLKYQPYSDGPPFVSQLRSDGGWEAVDAAHDDPPASAEQVIHPEKYPDEEPRNVTLEDRTSEDWERVRPPGRPDYAEVGQSGIASMIAFPLYDGGVRIVSPTAWLNYTDSNEVSTFDPLNYGFEAAEGWGGDRMHVYTNDENETAYVWRIEWDSQTDATEFLDSYLRVVSYWGGSEIRPDTYQLNGSGYDNAIRVIHDNDTVTIVNAPTVDDLPAVRNGSLPDETVVEERNRTGTDLPASDTDEDLTQWEDRPAQPGFGHEAAVVALFVAIVVLVRRRNRGS